MGATTQPISKWTRLDDTRRRVERWRETRPHRHGPMPAALWDAAVAAARQHGLYPTARALRVDYGALKKHLQAADPGHALTSATFVELAPTRPMTSADTPACVIEVDSPRGTMRIQLSGVAPCDLIALAQMAWGKTA